MGKGKSDSARRRTRRRVSEPVSPDASKQLTKPIVFIRKAEVLARTGFANSSLYDAISEGAFPKPVPLGTNTVAWVEQEVTDWQKARIAERDSRAAKPARRA